MIQLVGDHNIYEYGLEKGHAHGTQIGKGNWFHLWNNWEIDNQLEIERI